MRDADTVLGAAAGRPRSAASTALLTGLAGEHGMPAARALRGTGLTASGLRAPEAVVTAGQELQVVVNLVTELGPRHPGLGLEAGRRYRAASTFGTLGLTALASGTLGEAVAFGLEYADLTYMFSPFRPTRQLGTGALRTFLDDRAIRDGLGDDVARFLAEREMAAVVTFVRDLTGSGRGLDHIVFAYPEPSSLLPYTRVLGVRPAFGEGRTYGILSRRMLESRLPQADPETAALAARRCRLERARYRPSPQPARPRVPAGESLTSLVRAALEQAWAAGEGALPQRRLAARLNMSERSLRRGLAAEGSGYSSLADASAAEAARRLLAEGRTVEQVAAALGFSGASSFTHAFKRWTGTTPGRYARESAATPVLTSTGTG